MSNITKILLLAASLNASGFYPSSPDPRVTTGSTCARPSEYRYKERIPYCERNVSKETKRHVIAIYDSQLGYTVSQMNRQEFKIDHYIPLCMGGSNELNNLWPQHASIYAYTDPLEPRLCDLMAAGYFLQRQAIQIIMQAKANPASVPSIMQTLPDPRNPNHRQYFGY